MDNGGGAIVAVVLIVAVLLYFAPSINASVRRTRNQGSVQAINVFLGWTLVGWVVALAMSCSDDIIPTDAQKAKAAKAEDAREAAAVAAGVRAALAERDKAAVPIAASGSGEELKCDHSGKHVFVNGKELCAACKAEL